MRSSQRYGRGGRRRLLLSSLISATLFAATSLIVVVAAPASAASPTTTLNFTGDATLQSQSFYAGCNGCIPGDSDLGVRLTAAVSAHWTPSATVAYQYSSSLLRQGQTLDLTDKLTPGDGPLTLTWSLTGDAGVYNFDGSGPQFPAAGSDQNIVTFGQSVSDTSTCPLKLNGDGSYDCQATHTFDVFNASIPVVGGVDISVPLTTTVSISPDGIVTVRSITVGGGPLLTNNITFNGPSPATVADNVAVPCNAIPGNDFVYDLASSSTTPSYSATTSVNLKIDVTVVFVTATVLDTEIASVGPTPGTMTLTAPSTPVDFGPVLANNIPPTIHSPTSYSGNEGSAIGLDASATTSVCPSNLTYVWNISDGGTEYGAQPQHVFADNGIYSGLLTVSDENGNTSKQSFSVNVANVAPTANAGPDTSAPWGVPIAFNGSAVDPSPVDQNTLSFTWDFGDGTPPLTIGAGGSSTTHAYAAPGTYTASLVVTDKDGGVSAPSTRTITIVKRDVTLSYLGATSGTYDTAANLGASLVDQFGQAVNAGPVDFTIGSTDEGTAGTNSSGIANQTSMIEIPAGAYTVNATYPGNALYNTATPASSPFSVGLKATSVTYTGALTGGPNKTITLSAIVKDASGTPLSGVTVNFVLGSQSASAVTDASGLAATSLKLAQKNGTYTLTATYGGTAGKYSGSGTSATFKLQAK
jgi:PKD repeat protein